MPENLKIDDCRVLGANGEVFAAFAVPEPDEWSTLAVGRFLSALVDPGLDDGNRHIESIITHNVGIKAQRRSLLVCARARIDRDTDPATRFDDDLWKLMATAKRYGIVPVGREQAERLTVHLGFEAQIRESEKL